MRRLLPDGLSLPVAAWSRVLQPGISPIALAYDMKEIVGTLFIIWLVKLVLLR